LLFCAAPPHVPRPSIRNDPGFTSEGLSMATLFEEVRRDRSAPYEAFSRAGLVGCAEGSSDLSENYKEAVVEILEGKG
jgi:hypothetical protein